MCFISKVTLDSMCLCSDQPSLGVSVVYKAISDSLEKHKIMNCIVLSMYHTLVALLK